MVAKGVKKLVGTPKNGKMREDTIFLSGKKPEKQKNNIFCGVQKNVETGWRRRGRVNEWSQGGQKIGRHTHKK